MATMILPMTHGQVLREFIRVAGRAVLHTSSNWTPSISFTAGVDVWFPISVAAGGALGETLPVYAWSVQPYIDDSEGRAKIKPRLEQLPGAEISVTSVEGVHVQSGALVTSEGGRAVATVWADAGAPEEGGLVSGRVRLKIRKDTYQLEREQDIRIPCALVVSANGAQLVARPGRLLDPILLFSGHLLQPGDAVKVGGEFIGRNVHLRVRFCNAQEVVLTSHSLGGKIRCGAGQPGPPGSALESGLGKSDCRHPHGSSPLRADDRLQGPRQSGGRISGDPGPGGLVCHHAGRGRGRLAA